MDRGDSLLEKIAKYGICGASEEYFREKQYYSPKRRDTGTSEFYENGKKFGFLDGDSKANDRKNQSSTRVGLKQLIDNGTNQNNCVQVYPPLQKDSQVTKSTTKTPIRRQSSSSSSSSDTSSNSSGSFWKKQQVNTYSPKTNEIQKNDGKKLSEKKCPKASKGKRGFGQQNRVFASELQNNTRGKQNALEKYRFSTGDESDSNASEGNGQNQWKQQEQNIEKGEEKKEEPEPVPSTSSSEFPKYITMGVWSGMPPCYSETKRWSIVELENMSLKELKDTVSESFLSIVNKEIGG